MAWPNIFKLEKLQIKSFEDPERKRQIDDPFEAMFNPTSIKQSHSIQYAWNDEVRGISTKAKFRRMVPSKLHIDLLFDGSGVNQMGVLNVFSGVKTVSQRIEEFMKHCYRVEGSSHEPRF